MRGGGFGDAVDDVGLGDAGRREEARVDAAVSGIEEDDASFESGRQLAGDAIAKLGLRPRTDPPVQPLEGLEGLVSGVAVRVEPAVALEVADRLVGLEVEY